MLPIRRLLRREEVLSLLQLEDSDLQQLIDTRQITDLRIRGHQRFDSLEIWRFIDAYKIVSNRRTQ